MRSQLVALAVVTTIAFPVRSIAQSNDAALVRISVVDSTIAPVRSSGRVWDGLASGASGAVSSIARAMDASDPYAAVAQVVASLALGGIAPPDPYGNAEIDTGSGYGSVRTLATRAAGPQDEVRPHWAARTTWDHVQLDDRTRVRVRLQDRDVLIDDEIGTAVITAADLRAALRSGNVYQVPVGRQTANQILFVGIEVSAVRPPDAPTVLQSTAAPVAGGVIEQQLVAQARSFAAGMTPVTRLTTRQLSTGATASFSIALEAGRCYRVLAAGGDGVQDLDMRIFDTFGRHVDSDLLPDRTPVVGMQRAICPSASGTWRIDVSMDAGFGEFGLVAYGTANSSPRVAAVQAGARPSANFSASAFMAAALWVR